MVQALMQLSLPNSYMDPGSNLNNLIGPESYIGAETCSFRSRRSPSPPAYRVPAEILAAIFICCAQDYHDSHLHSRTVPNWINVSYVCHHWRRVALDCPTLWGYHFAVSLRWTEVLLARSRKAALRICIVFRFIPSKSLRFSLVEKVMVHAERIEELHLDLSVDSTRRILSMLSSRVPRLQTLQISTEEYCTEWSSLPFHGDTPSLRTLELRYCPVPWHSFKLSALTTLSLREFPVRFQRSMEEFLATLRCMPGLIHLYLDHALASCVDFVSNVAFYTFQKINLSQLSRLLIIEPLLTVTALLSCIDMPLEAEVRIKCEPNREIGFSGDYLLLPFIFTQRSGGQTLSSTTIRSLVIESPTRNVAKLTFSASEFDCGSFRHISRQEWGRNIPLKILIVRDRATTRGEWDDIISGSCRFMPLTNVQSLHVIGPPFSPVFWEKTLGCLPELRYIKLSQGYMPNLAPVLALPLAVHEGEENHGEKIPSGRVGDRVIVPKLEEMELYLIAFSSGGDSTLETPAITQRCLFDSLSGRDVPRGRLTMAQCKLSGSGSADRLHMVRSWDSLMSSSEEDDSDDDFDIDSDADFDDD